jgi:hypothetical protein
VLSPLELGLGVVQRKAPLVGSWKSTIRAVVLVTSGLRRTWSRTSTETLFGAMLASVATLAIPLCGYRRRSVSAHDRSRRPSVLVLQPNRSESSAQRPPRVLVIRGWPSGRRRRNRQPTQPRHVRHRDEFVPALPCQQAHENGFANNHSAKSTRVETRTDMPAAPSNDFRRRR